MKNLLKGIFICLFAVLLMSHNVSAAEVDFTSEPVVHQATLYDFYSRWNSQTNYSRGRVHTGAFNSFSSIEFYPYIAYQLPVGAYYMEINYNLGASNTITNNPSWFGGPNYATYSSSGAIMPFLSSDQVSSTTSDLTYRSYRSIFKYAGGTTFSNAYPIKFGSTGSNMFAGESYLITSVVFWKVQNSGASNQDIINSINNQSQALSDINDSLQDTNDKLDNINDNLQDRQDEEDEALDNIADQTPEDISDNGSTENQATTNLIGLFQSFITALTNITQANNCNSQ